MRRAVAFVGPSLDRSVTYLLFWLAEMSPAQLFLVIKSVPGVLFAGGAVALGVLIVRAIRTGAGRSKDGTVIQVGNWKIEVGTTIAAAILLAALLAWCAYKILPTQFEQNGPYLKISAETPIEGTVIVSAKGAAAFLQCNKQAQEVKCVPVDVKPGAKCGPAPALISGLGRLQSAAVPFDPQSSAGIEGRKKMLRDVLAQRGLKEWNQRVLSYRANERGNEIVRLVFNGVAPENEAPMCAWLRCEGWTYGPCKMVGAAEPGEPEHEPSPAGSGGG